VELGMTKRYMNKVMTQLNTHQTQTRPVADVDIQTKHRQK